MSGSPSWSASWRPAGGRRRARSLRTRLVLSAVTLIAVVASVIGTVTWIAFRSYLHGQLDDRLGGVAMRASGGPHRPPELPDPPPDSHAPLDFVTGGGAPVGTVAGLLGEDGALVRAVASTQVQSAASGGPTQVPLDAAQLTALASVARDGRPHSVELPGRGEYRVRYAEGFRGAFLVGVPTTEVRDALGTLVVVEVCVTGAGLLAAGLAGATIVGLALRPLRRVAATATRVAELPLHSGEVALHERVPESEADPATEVGQVGAALNRMLGHVASALTARQQSETRVRQFVADAGHELRTPLAVIRGYAELTRRGREEAAPDVRHALGRIEAEAVRMTGLVEDLLLLARLDAGRPLSYDPVDLAPLVVDAVGDARAAGPGHRWLLELPAVPAPVRGDAARLHQVLANLLANARTHTPPGTAVTTRIRDTGPAVVLEVEDEGPGIPDALLPHVFERFARGDAARTRSAGSTGLGLAIVRAVTAAHGGTVTVASRPGRTVFTVTLPAAGATPEPAAGAAPGPAAEPAAGPGSARAAEPPDPAGSGPAGTPAGRPAADS
ncbi:HAMP domain-containing histidine kinase [Streptomyces sp. LP05-1]|uniref:histidine kinase n=1 Tax=Streptomyces pyxinae TaxID=2970734 RepID=A0ABT2CPW9_9ACTN|nr:HAMP domain-containing sensor histidine kinase [Streptomyces sp. LP05-1]MCS0639488.1 HAMP domain-containing histidine kinase [Streptomyces sp. LP05-1]